MPGSNYTDPKLDRANGEILRRHFTPAIEIDGADIKIDRLIDELARAVEGRQLTADQRRKLQAISQQA